MIKRILVHICLVTCALAGLLAGCGHAPHYDERLLQVDSLLQNIQDSYTALNLLDSLQRGSLANDADKAYYDLLLTQALYKCYIRATSDSSINHALEYFTATSRTNSSAPIYIKVQSWRNLGCLTPP